MHGGDRQLMKTSQIECILCWVNVTGEVEAIGTRASYISMTVDPAEQYCVQCGMCSTLSMWSACNVWSVVLLDTVIVVALRPHNYWGNACQYGGTYSPQGGCFISYFPALIPTLH